MSDPKLPVLASARPGRRFVQLVSVVTDENRFRSYTITVAQRESDGRWCVVRRWGRIGCDEHETVTEHETYAQAVAAAEQTMRKRLSRGYSVVTAK